MDEQPIIATGASMLMTQGDILRDLAAEHAAAGPATEQDLIDVRILVEDALRVYAETDAGRGRVVAGVHANNLADNVRGWTHTSRLRDFVNAHNRKATD
jgi:hypothetical protein